jgi:murein endopeptidase
MSTVRMSGMTALLALAGMLSVPPVATALDAQDYANIQSECRREAQDYGIAPEQIEEYVNGCVLAAGGMPPEVSEAQALPVDAGAEAPADVDQATGYSGEQDTGGAVE